MGQDEMIPLLQYSFGAFTIRSSLVRTPRGLALQLLESDPSELGSSRWLEITSFSELEEEINYLEESSIFSGDTVALRFWPDVPVVVPRHTLKEVISFLRASVMKAEEVIRGAGHGKG